MNHDGTTCNKHQTCLEREISSLTAENAKLRAEIKNHHSWCLTCQATESELIALRAALVRAHEWMISTYDYESLSPAGTAILKDEMLAAKLAIDGFSGLASVKGEGR